MSLTLKSDVFTFSSFSWNGKLCCILRYCKIKKACSFDTEREKTSDLDWETFFEISFRFSLL